jgi:GT2 family glycosyltransferase
MTGIRTAGAVKHDRPERKRRMTTTYDAANDDGPGTGSIAVIVLNYNKKPDLLEALESIYASDYPDFTVVVVDNDSSDGSADAVAEQFPQASLIRNPENSGVSKGRNTGWRYADENYSFEYVIFVDDDAVLTRDCLSKLVDAYRQFPEAGVLAGKAFTNFETNQLMSVGIRANFYTGLIFDMGVGEYDNGQYNEPREIDAAGGFAFMVRANLFRQLNAFDERFSPYGWEDVDFSLRAREKGYTVRYVPEARLCHKGTKAGRKPKAGYERYKIKNYLYLLKKHASPIQKICCLFAVPMKGVYVVFQMIFSGNANVITSQFRGFFEGLIKAGKSQKKTDASLND